MTLGRKRILSRVQGVQKVQWVQRVLFIRFFGVPLGSIGSRDHLTNEWRCGTSRCSSAVHGRRTFTQGFDLLAERV